MQFCYGNQEYILNSKKRTSKTKIINQVQNLQQIPEGERDSKGWYSRDRPLEQCAYTYTRKTNEIGNKKKKREGTVHRAGVEGIYDLEASELETGRERERESMCDKEIIEFDVHRKDLIVRQKFSSEERH